MEFLYADPQIVVRSKMVRINILEVYFFLRESTVYITKRIKKKLGAQMGGNSLQIGHLKIGLNVPNLILKGV